MFCASGLTIHSSRTRFAGRLNSGVRAHVDILLRLAASAALPLLLAYFYCYSQLYEAVVAQKPDWLRYKGEPSIFYANLPRRFDANVSIRMIAIVFSTRARQLDAHAYGYARAIRLLLPAYVAGFVILAWLIFRA